MKKIIVLIITLSLLLNIILIYVFIIKGDTFQSKDNRIALSMSESNKEFVLDEMRVFLESIQQINEGLSTHNTEKIIKACQVSGGSVIEHAPKGLLKTFPIEFKTLGFSTHGIFDEIGINAKNGVDTEIIQNQVNLLLNNCVACHKSYKISTANY